MGNVFNLSFAQWDQKLRQWDVGMQGFYETALQDGGNADPALSYMKKGEHTGGLGANIGYQIRQTHVSASYLGIARSGRFLFPREWGGEQFYASLPRERLEGNGGVHAFTIKYNRTWDEHHSLLAMGLGKVTLPDINNSQLNKYSLPSYYHLAAEASHNFRGFMEGASAKVLIVHKLSNNRLQPLENKINRVDLWNLNLVLDYQF